MSHPIISPKKLIEVALPLDAINAAAAREKSIRHGHPSTLHLWWARRPLAAARAVIFSQLVNDPEDLWRCQNPGIEPNVQVRGHWTRARTRLFRLIEELVLWENTTNERVLNEAREAIRESWRQTCELNKNHPQAADLFDPDKLPGLHDPFAGGGSIPLEAQRLGLEAYASDLNPVAVLINKAMIEIPPKFAGRPPVHPLEEMKDADAGRGRKGGQQRQSGDQNSANLFSGSITDSAPSSLDPQASLIWVGAQGLAEDVRYYGKWMRDEAEKRIGHLYPKVEITPEMVTERPDLKPYVGQKLTVIAWLWTRTVKSPNPVFSHVDVPLASSFILSSKPSMEAYVHPEIGQDNYRLTVKVGPPPATAYEGVKAARANFRCLLSGVPISGDYVKSEGKVGRLGVRLMAIVAAGPNGRVYLSPIASHESIASTADPTWRPNLLISGTTQYLGVKPYGMDRFDQIFTDRQLVALTTLSNLVSEARKLISSHASGSHCSDDKMELESGGMGVQAYSEAVSIYLALSVDKAADYWSTICTWHSKKEIIRNTFGRQALPMTWDYAEVNPFSNSTGNVSSGIEWAQKAISRFPCCSDKKSTAIQADAQTFRFGESVFISTDPPYFDNVPYADLSDFFYVWLRRSLKDILPSMFGPISTPKSKELVAFAHRHVGKVGAEEFFLNGMTKAMENIALTAHPTAPVTVYYAFKQSETSTTGTNSTGWETFLDAVLRSGFSISGTWPVRTELGNRMRSTDSNALASSIVLVCRPRPKALGFISRRELLRMLNTALPNALDAMTRTDEGEHSPVAAVDLSQAIIGPGMAIFSRYEAVLEADGTPMTVKTALQLINRFLAEDDFDADTQFCLHWFEAHGWDAGKFGEADTLARAKGTSVDGVQRAGVIEAGGGSVRLLRWREYPVDWDAAADARLPVWEALHQLIRAYKSHGDAGAARVLAATASRAEAARQLAYRLYTLCERKNWTEDARAYNEVVTGWSGIESAANAVPDGQQTLEF